MFKIEIFLIVGVALAPIVAFLFMIPSVLKKKKEKTAKVEQKVTEEVQVETPKMEEAPMVVEDLKKKRDFDFDNEFSTDDFKDFIKSKKDKVSSPKFNFPEEEHLLDPIEHFRRPRPNKEPKTLTEEFQSLSPRMKALIMSGAFDRKDFE